jgi:hypothetical protein
LSLKEVAYNVPPSGPTHRPEVRMFIALAILLAIAWLMGFTLLHVSSAAIHILIVLAIISLVLHLVRGRRTA